MAGQGVAAADLTVTGLQVRAPAGVVRVRAGGGGGRKESRNSSSTA